MSTANPPPDDYQMRCDALDQAVRSSPRTAPNTEIVSRAKAFLDFIRGTMK